MELMSASELQRPPQHHILLNASPVAAVAAAEIPSRREAISARRAGDGGDLKCQRLDRPPSRHLQDEAMAATTQEITEPISVSRAISVNRRRDTCKSASL
nr:unnamed protein product [Spirometra erinaceieuropaei]